MMKTRTPYLTLVFFLSVFFNSSQAQTMGARIGFNSGYQVLSTQDARYVSEMNAGPLIGLTVNNHWFDKASVQIELSYMHLNHGAYPNDVGINKQEYQYGTLGLLFKYYPTKTKRITVLAGPQFSMLIDQENEAKESSDLLIQAGAEYWFYENVGLGMRYLYGTTNQYDGATEGTKMNTRALQFSLLIRFKGHQFSEYSY